MSLKERLIESIAAEGPMPFERFMAACLYDPQDGFFGSGPLRSVKSGDFLTSPEVSPWFGRTLARWVDRHRRDLDGPFRLVELGAGSGSLLESLLGALRSPPDDVWCVEASPAAREALGARLDGVEVVDDLAALPTVAGGVFIGNELLDNLPVALAVRAPGGWDERFVGLENDGLALVAVPARVEVAAWADAYGGDVPDGSLVEVQLEALAYLEAIIARLGDGAALFFDYGGTTEELEPRRTLGTLRTYRAHHLGPDPLLEPGETDVTVDVNFSPLVDLAARLGFGVRLLRQDDFLVELGLRDQLQILRRAERERAAAGETMERLAIRSQIVDAETLLHPRGLGDFRVLEVVPRREPIRTTPTS